MTDEKAPPLSPETKAILDFLADRFNPGIQQQIAMSRAEMQAIRFPVAPVDKLPVRIKCVHPNGYKFTAVVVPSDTYEGGRLRSIDDEQWPTDAELCETIDWWSKRNRFRDPSNPSAGYDPDTQLWLYDNIRLPILRQCGKELPIDWREDMQESVKKLKTLAAKEQAKLTEQLRKLQVEKPAPPPEVGTRTPRVSAAPALDPK